MRARCPAALNASAIYCHYPRPLGETLAKVRGMPMSMAGRNDAVPTALLTTVARLGQVALGGSIAAAGLALGTAASGSGQITQYYFVFQDAPILVRRPRSRRSDRAAL